MLITMPSCNTVKLNLPLPCAAQDAQRTVEAEYRNQHPQGSKAESAQQTSGASSRTSVAAAPPPPPSDTAPVAVSISAPDATAETTTDLEVDVSVQSAVKASEQDFTNMDELD